MDESEYIHPSGIRVWRGFRHKTFIDDKAAFLAKLGSVFVPLTCQAMIPVGLKYYLPAVLDGTDFSLPDEVALVGYGSPENYYAASRDTVIGRAYGELHSLVFNFDSDGPVPDSKSAFPQPYAGTQLETSQPYYFSGGMVNWYSVPVTLYSIPVADTINQPGCANELAGYLSDAAENLEIQEAILVYDPGYIMLWIAGASPANPPAHVLRYLASLSHVSELPATNLNARPMWSIQDDGVKLRAGQNYFLTMK